MGEGELAQVGRRPGVEREVRHVRVELRVFERRARGVVEEHLAPSREAEHDFELRGVRCPAERDDLPRIHPQIYD